MAFDMLAVVVIGWRKYRGLGSKLVGSVHTIRQVVIGQRLLRCALPARHFLTARRSEPLRARRDGVGN
jgi:hypothetical protein